MNADPSPPPDLGDFARRLLALEADPSFQALQSLQNRTSFFHIVGTTDTERWHSAFWAWMLDPDGSHGLGDFAVRRLLMRACDENGRLRAAPIWRASDGPAPSPPTMSDLMRWRITEAAAAPGPLTEFSEVTSRKVMAAIDGTSSIPAAQGASKKRHSSGDAARFDVLLGLQGDHPASGLPAVPRAGAQLTLIIVVEVKVKAPYDAAQLRRYSKWLHDTPASGDLVLNDSVLPFVDRLGKIESHARPSGVGQDAEAWGVGIFLARSIETLRPTPPTELVPSWSPVEFCDLLVEILEPALQQSNLAPDARPLLNNYINLIADPKLKVLKMAPAEHRELVRSLYNRHKETFARIAQVLGESSSEDLVEGDAVAGALNELAAQQKAVQRNSSLTPIALIEAGLANVGDILVHRPLKNRTTRRVPFAGNLEVELATPDRKGFRLINGPEEIKAKLGDALYTATGLLSEAYDAVGGRFSGSGNAALAFKHGDYAGSSLEQVYGEARG